VREEEKPPFDVKEFLASAGPGREILEFHENQILFSQGKTADSVIYLQSGRAKLTVGSSYGKKATITCISPGDFVGEESLSSAGGFRTSTAIATTDCNVLRIERDEMLRALDEEQPLSEAFTAFLFARGMCIQSDMVDQLFDSSEKRLARALLLISGIGETGERELPAPEVTEERLAEMIGAPSSTVRFLMNRFQELGFIRYDGQIQVHHSLLNTILHDRLPGNNTATPAVFTQDSDKDGLC
jgi:CRP-like cAMP-binding protein